jgi:hypothetical protein
MMRQRRCSPVLLAPHCARAWLMSRYSHGGLGVIGQHTATGHSNARAAFSEAAVRALQIFAHCTLVSEESRVY